MNICVTHYAYYPTTGGVETHLLDLCTELVQQGHTVHALVGSMPNAPSVSTVEGIQIHRVDWMNPETMRERKLDAEIDLDTTWPSMLREIKAAYRQFVEDHEINAIHAHNFHHFLPEYGLALTELRQEIGIVTVLTIHEMWGEFLCHDLLARTHWDAIIAVGQNVYGDLVAQIPSLKNLHIVVHGVNTSMFHPALDGNSLRKQLNLDSQRVILHPARLLPWKGVHTTVEAFAELVNSFPDAVLVITDTQEILDWADELRGYREHILALIEAKGLSNKIILRPFNFFEELPQAYAMSEVVVYPTCGEEPFGLVPLESMATGTPIVATLSGGLIESVVDGETGFLVPKEDSERLAQRIATILAHPELARRMGQAGRNRVVKHFARSRMVRQVVAIYEHARRNQLTTHNL